MCARVCVCVCVCVCVPVCVCVVVVVIVHWHCSAQLSMFNMEKRYRNKIIIIIINRKFLRHDRKSLSTVLDHVSAILNLQKRCASLCCCLYTLGN